MEYRYDQERDSSKKHNKQVAIEFLLNLEYGATVMNTELARMLNYNIEDQEERNKYGAMMSQIKRFLLSKGRVLKSISGMGYYLLKPSQVSSYCYRTYILSASRLYEKSEFVIEQIDKSKLNEQRLEEFQKFKDLNNQLITAADQTIRESPYFSRKEYYDNLKEEK